AMLFLVAAAAHAQGKEEAAREGEREGIIVDKATSAPIAGAVVTADGKAVLTDARGHYRAAAGTQPLQVRAVGYGRS
ncbi:hypothetical protein, partial [Enterococcus faecalis]|uniref:hypothetical protein n=1 Tax=Enterococcus faecalis TaxID=1351 RepID=UPI00403FBB6A